MTAGLDIDLTLPAAPKALLDWIKRNPSGEFAGLKFGSENFRRSGKSVNFKLNTGTIPREMLEKIKEKIKVDFTGLKLDNKTLEISGKDPLFGEDFTFFYAVEAGENRLSLTGLKAPPMLKPFIKMGIASIIKEDITSTYFSLAYNKNTGDIKITF